MVVLLLIRKYLRHRLRKYINIALLFGLLMLFVVDMMTMYLFQSRLSLFDLGQFISPSSRDFSGLIIFFLVVLIGGGILTFWLVQQKFFRKNQKLLLAVVSLLFALAYGIMSLARGGMSMPDNILSLNRHALQERLGGDELMGIGAPKYTKYFTQVPGQNRRPNVIVVFAESLSAIDSQLVGGKYNNLPYFDKIQSQGMRFTNFISNGCTSDTAHIALLQWVEPRKFAWEQNGAYSGYRAANEPLAEFFHKAWYDTFFVSSVSLDFLWQKSFLSGVGFQTLYGEEFFKKEKKYVFDAAPDLSLYTKTLELTRQQDKPYLAVLQTISFHKPYYSPYGNTEADALRYADKSLYFFYQQLKKDKFFDNGILIIVGDHRKMESAADEEKDALGPLRYARPLATIVGKNIAPWQVNTSIVQQTDFFYSLKQLIAKGNVQVSKLYNNVFGGTAGRNRWMVFCRYYESKYGLAVLPTIAQTFGRISELQHTYPSVYKYIQSYMAFQSPDLSGWANSTKQTKPVLTVIAHQWSPRELPENSLSGFLLAKEHGADGVEMDVMQTKDKQNVVVHGKYFRASTCGGTYDITKHTLADIRKECPLKDGEQLLTLEEMLRGLKGLFDYYFLDIKVYNSADAEDQTLGIIQTVQKLGMDDKVIFSSYDKTATFVLGSYQHIHAGRDTFNLKELPSLPKFTHEYYLMPQSLITSATPQEAADMGKKLVIYTINTFDDLKKLYNLWVHMVMTDDVLMAREGGEKLSME